MADTRLCADCVHENLKVSEEPCASCYRGSKFKEKETKEMENSKYNELIDKIDTIEKDLRDLKKEKKKIEKYREYKTMSDEIAIMCSAMKESFCEQGFAEEESMEFVMELMKTGIRVNSYNGR